MCGIPMKDYKRTSFIAGPENLKKKRVLAYASAKDKGYGNPRFA